MTAAVSEVPSLNPEKKNNLKLVIIASSVGTLIEWYDLLLAVILASVLSNQLFPAGENKFIETLAIVATTYLIRPFGSLFFGNMGDKSGRKNSFLISLLLMGAATFLIGCLLHSTRWDGWRQYSFLYFAFYKDLPSAANIQVRLFMLLKMPRPTKGAFIRVLFRRHLQ